LGTPFLKGSTIFPEKAVKKRPAIVAATVVLTLILATTKIATTKVVPPMLASIRLQANKIPPTDSNTRITLYSGAKLAIFLL